MKEQKGNEDDILPSTKEQSNRHLPLIKDNSSQKEISKPDKIETFLGAAKKTLLDSVLGGIPVVGALYNLHSEFNDSLDKQKQEAILNSLLERQGYSEEDINKMLEFMCDPYGAVLYNKVQKISQKAPKNDEFIEMFVNILDEVVNSDFKDVFTQHSLYLELIDRLSIHAILLLRNHQYIPNSITTTVGDGPYVQGRSSENNWFKDLAEAITKLDYRYMDLAVLELVIRELYNNGLIFINQNGSDHDVIIPTQGQELIKYLTR